MLGCALSTTAALRCFQIHLRNTGGVASTAYCRQLTKFSATTTSLAVDWIHERCSGNHIAALFDHVVTVFNYANNRQDWLLHVGKELLYMKQLTMNK